MITLTMITVAGIDKKIFLIVNHKTKQEELKNFKQNLLLQRLEITN
jgi:hypothetical protein